MIVDVEKPIAPPLLGVNSGIDIGSDSDFGSY